MRLKFICCFPSVTFIHLFRDIRTITCSMCSDYQLVFRTNYCHCHPNNRVISIKLTPEHILALFPSVGKPPASTGFLPPCKSCSSQCSRWVNSSGSTVTFNIVRNSLSLYATSDSPETRLYVISIPTIKPYNLTAQAPLQIYSGFKLCV
jgi:hypothetical protein